MINLDILLKESKERVEKEREERKKLQSVQDMLKKTKEKPKKAFQAKIYTKYGGNAILVWSFANNASEAIREIQSLPHFKAFSSRPVQVELNF